MAGRWPLLSASVGLLVATPSAPPARALDEPERLRLVGERAFADGLYPLSRRVLERFVAEYPNDPHAGSALFLLGRARFALGDTESALEAFRRAQAAISPAEALEAKFWEAETLFRLRRFTEARAAYDAVVKTDAAAPRAPEALYGLAWSDLELGRPETAIAELRELLARWPDHALVPSATLHLARTLAEQKRFGDALPLLEGFATKYPNHKQLPDAQYLLGWARVKSGDTKAGLADLRAFVAAAPNHELAPAARRMITETITRHGDRSELGAAYKTLMDETPPTPEGLYDAGSIAGRLARPSDQVAAWRRLRKEFPDHPLATRAALDLANAAFKRKDWKDAAAQAQAAAQSGDGGVRAEALLLAGEAEGKLGRYGAAAQAVQAGGGVKGVEGRGRARAAARPATPLALVPPPPELTALIPFAEAPLDKPPVGVRELPLPEGPTDLPPFPPATIVAPWPSKPTAALAQPAPLACVGAFFGVAAAALECGQARIAKGEYDDAAKALEQAARSGEEKDVVLEARYWLGETYWQLGRAESADRLFRQVVQTAPEASAFGLWATHSGGWTALRTGDAIRARDTFAQLLAGAVPAAMDPWARHGLGLASYALGRYDEAVAAWEALRSRGAPGSLARDVGFWLGEALGRVGRYDRAAVELNRFVNGGPHALLDAGWLRLGWWSLTAQRPKESAAAFRTYLTPPTSPAAAPRTGTERDWAEAGLALALLGNDVSAARDAARGLEARRSPLRDALFLRFAKALVDGKKGAEAQAIIQELLGANLTPTLRGWVLLLNGEASRLQGNLDDARTQYDLARRADPTTATGWFAGLRVAQINFELREFAQAARDLAGLVATAPSAEARATALLLQAEAAYHAGTYAAASAAFRRALVEFSGHPLAGAARLGVAWAALRQDKDDEARREFLEFVRRDPRDPQAADALLLAAELALKAPTEWTQAKALLDRIVAEYPNRPRTEFAKLNRAVLLLRTGDLKAAQAELSDWIARAPFGPLLGRAYAALGAALLAGGVPADAAKAFAQAQREGLGALATLGLAASELARGKPDVAKGLFEDARDKGTPAIAHAAEYGLAATAFLGGAHKEFRQPALAELDAAPKGRGAPRLLYVLTGLAVEEKDWAGALGFAKRLASEFPVDEAADDAFESIGAAAAQARAWPVVAEAYSELRSRYPKSPFADAAIVTLAEAQVETGRVDVARRELEKFVTSAPADAKLGRAGLLLAPARAATRDRTGAIDAYARAAKDGRVREWSKTEILSYARLLAEDKRAGEARAVLSELLRRADGDRKSTRLNSSH